MNNMETLIITIALVAVVAVIMGLVIPRLKKQGVDIDKTIEQTKNVLNAITEMADIVKPFVDESKVASDFESILAATKTGVANAEQLWHAGQLEGNERKGAAQKYVIDTLGLLKVPVTPEVERVVNGAIEAEVLGMGHKPKPQSRLPLKR